VEAVPSLSPSLGRITISNAAVAQIVGYTAAECYGVVGMVARGRVAKLISREQLSHVPVLARALRQRRSVRPGARGTRAAPHERLPRALTHGISIRGSGAGLSIDLHVVVEYGLNLAEVAATVRSRVSYEVERLTGLRVDAVEVHISDVRRSA